MKRYLLLFACLTAFGFSAYSQSLPLRRLFLTSDFGYRIHPLTGRNAFHRGIDLRARSDTVFAVDDGRVGALAFDPKSGVYLRLRQGALVITYGHLSQVFVLAGDSVSSGQPLAITGNTGAVTGEHLHFAVTYNGRPLNPLLFLYHLFINFKIGGTSYEYPTIQTALRAGRK